MKNKLFAIVSAIMLLFFMTSIESNADIDEKNKKKNEVQRAAFGFFDLQYNTVSNIEFSVMNDGRYGYDVRRGIGTGFWPRGSRNQYIFGGGIWFGAQKLLPRLDDPQELEFRKLVSLTYNPNSALSWMTPGRIEDGVIRTSDIKTYRIYFSTDMLPNTGEPLDPDDGPNWPIWDSSRDPLDTLKFSRYFGYYINDVSLRNNENFERGPSFITGEDIFATFHDLDLVRYEGGVRLNRERGYPLGLQHEQMIYSWGFGDYKDFIFVKYDVINASEDTLWNCWLAPIIDVDLARAPFLRIGASNDRVTYYFEDDTLNLAAQWTDPQFGEAGNGFGYLGFDFLESPSILKPPVLTPDGDTVFTTVTINRQEYVVPLPDVTHPDYAFVRNDSAFYDVTNQLGLVTFQNWSIAEDKTDDVQRYDFIAEGILRGDTGPGDKRFMMATGPFHLRPSDTSRTVVGIMIASTAKGGEADGTVEDMAELVRLDKFAQSVYDNNFRAPAPPRFTTITEWIPGNNSMTIKWNGESELTVDEDEKGLDFMGYRIQRARRHDLDTFATNQINPGGLEYPRGAGPLGWKTIQEYTLPTPIQPSVHVVGNPDNPADPIIDSLRIVGPVLDRNGNIEDTLALRFMRVGRGILLHSNARNLQTHNNYVPAIAGIDTVAFNDPWGKYYKKIADASGITQSQMDAGNVFYKPAAPTTLDKYLVGVARFDRARIPYNPLLFRNFTFEVSPEYKAILDTVQVNGVAPRYRLVEVEEMEIDTVTGDTTFRNVIIESSLVDTVFFTNSFRTLRENGTTKTIMDGAIPISHTEAMRDTVQIKMALDSLYSYIKQSLIRVEWFDFEQDSIVQVDVIQPYMERITNGRTFTDIGDDNRDGEIFETDDDATTEKLINNIPYYYRVLSFDQGDAFQPTPIKVTPGLLGLPNFATTYPEAVKVSAKPRIEIISVDSNNLGGLTNFEFYAIDEDRLLQRFEGDTLELRFSPEWIPIEEVFERRNTQEQVTVNTALYARQMSLWNTTKDIELFNTFYSFEPNACVFASRFSSLTENTAYRAAADEIRYDTTDTGQIIENDLGFKLNKGVYPHQGIFNSGDFTLRNYCYSQNFTQEAYGVLGFKFDFHLQQLGGRYRPDEITIESGNANTYLTFFDDLPEAADRNRILTMQNVAVDTFGLIYESRVQAGVAIPRISIRQESFNNGPIDAVLEFTSGGVEEVELEWGYSNADPREDLNGSNVRKSVFSVPYLNVRVVNQYDYEYTDLSGETKTVDMNREFEHLNINPANHFTDAQSQGNFRINRQKYPDPRNLPEMGIEVSEFYDKFNIAAFGHVNIEQNSGFVTRPRSIARPANGSLRLEANTYSGLQGRYYLSGSDSEGNVIDFINVLNISGARFIFDYKNINRLHSILNQWPRAEDFEVGEDFKAGDRVRLKTFGGAAGLPYPGATVKAVVKGGSTESLTDEIMDGITVVPNPYYITHLDERSPYDNKLFFTKLPEECTIDIYTVDGQFVQKLEHNRFTNEDGRRSVDVWNLLMENGLRVQSQTLIAHIKAPNGAETIRRFSVVLGNFRITD